MTAYIQKNNVAGIGGHGQAIVGIACCRVRDSPDPLIISVHTDAASALGLRIIGV